MSESKGAKFYLRKTELVQAVQVGRDTIADIQLMGVDSRLKVSRDGMVSG